MRQSEVPHVAEPLGNCIYAFPSLDPSSAGEPRSAISKQRHNKRQRSPPEPQGLETDSF